MIGPEQLYDKVVSPLVVELLAVCKECKPPIPIVTCSTFWNETTNSEGSCSSAAIDLQTCSLRMQEIYQIAQNKGMTPSNIMAKMMLGKPTKELLDERWYESTPETRDYFMNKVAPLMMRVERLVDDIYHFPTAIVVQAPSKELGYVVVGRHPSNKYEGIQFARIIAKHGYSMEAQTMLLGGDIQLSTRLASITRELKEGERVVIPRQPVPKELRKHAKIIIPLLRRDGNPPPSIGPKRVMSVVKQETKKTQRKGTLKRSQKVAPVKKRKKRKKGRWKTTNILK